MGGQILADQINQFMQGQGAVDLPMIGVAAQEERFAGGTILNLPDKFLQDVLQRNHADGASVLIDHDGEVKVALQKTGGAFPAGVVSGTYINLRSTAERSAPRAAVARTAKRVLDVNDAESLVEVALLAKGEPGVAGFLGQFEALVDARLRVEGRDLPPRTHGVAHGAAAQVQGVQDDVVSQAGAAGRRLWPSISRNSSSEWT